MKFKRLLAMFLVVATLLSLCCATFASATEEDYTISSEEIVQEAEEELAPEDDALLEPSEISEDTPQDVSEDNESELDFLEEMDVEEAEIEEPENEEVDESLLEVVPEGSEDELREMAKRAGEKFTCQVVGGYRFAQNLRGQGMSITSTGMHKINGQWAYCLAPFDSTGAIGYTQNNGVAAWANLSQDAKTAISLILAYGYPNFDFNEYNNSPPEGINVEFQKVAATQCIIWEIILGYRNTTWPYIRTGSYIKDCFGSHTILNAVYDDISNRLAKHGIIPSFASDAKSNAPAITMEYDTSIRAFKGVVTDTNGVLSGYDFTTSSTSDVKITQNGNQLTVITKNPNEAGFLAKAEGIYIGEDRIPVMAWSPSISNYQPLCTMAGADPTPIYFKLGEMKNGYCEIIKTTDSGSSAGFKMKLYNWESNYSEYGISDASGKVYVTDSSFVKTSDSTTKFEHLGDGKYTFKEYATSTSHPNRIEISLRSVDGTVIPIETFGPDKITLDETDPLGHAYTVPSFEVEG